MELIYRDHTVRQITEFGYQLVMLKKDGVISVLLPAMQQSLLGII